jgi:hypothetical protein
MVLQEVQAVEQQLLELDIQVVLELLDKVMREVTT